MESDTQAHLQSCLELQPKMEKDYDMWVTFFKDLKGKFDVLEYEYDKLKRAYDKLQKDHDGLKREHDSNKTPPKKTFPRFAEKRADLDSSSTPKSTRVLSYSSNMSYYFRE